MLLRFLPIRLLFCVTPPAPAQQAAGDSLRHEIPMRKNAAQLPFAVHQGGKLYSFQTR